MKVLYTLFIASVISLSLVNGQSLESASTDSDVIIVRTYEVWTSLYPSQIVISYNEGKSERIELENLKQKNWEINLNKINLVLKRIISNGYKLVASTSGGGDAIQVNTFVFVKEEESK